jgi:4-amino-4-deoxy-L-arabinose transferase-like glycosyltransferase
MTGMRLPLSRAQLVAIAAVLSLAGGLRVVNLANVISRTPDERVYTEQANVWLQSGQPGLQSLVETYKRDPVARYYPMPTRAGMIRLVAMMMKWTGRNDESVGAIVSCAASIISLYVMALMGIRFLPPWAALAGLLLYSVFPPALVIARRTWSDSLVELAGLLLVWLTCEITRNSGRRVWYLLFAAVGSASIAVKESMPVPYALCGLWILWVLVKERREWKNALTMILAAVAGLIASIWWLARMVGSLSDFFRIVSGIQGVNATNPYAIEYASGPGYLLLEAFWIVSPIVTVLGLVGLYAAFKRPREVAGASQPILWMGIFTLSNILIAMIIPHWLNLRYVSVAFGPICLLAGLGAWYLFSISSHRVAGGRRRVLAGIVTAILIAGAVADYRRFQRIFVRDATADLSIKMLENERHR